MNRRDFESVIPEDVGLVHLDERRGIYDPGKILEKLESLGPWYAHNIIALNQHGLHLGNHYHDYHEAFFTPNGSFDFRLVDIENPGNSMKHLLRPGQRIVLPPMVGHRVTGSSGAVLLGYGNQKFDPGKLIPCKSDVLKILDSL